MKIIVILEFIQANVYLENGNLAAVGNPQLTIVNLNTKQNKKVVFDNIYTVFTTNVLYKKHASYTQSNTYIKFPILEYYNINQNIGILPFTLETTPPAILPTKSFKIKIIQIDLLNLSWQTIHELPVVSISGNTEILLQSWS
ncbi:MAG TPA: hypothetical protein ENI61_04125 [Ignavibacteria bacterium]|nr:hypothetical protein [Ignavibacteria bacterium]